MITLNRIQQNLQDVTPQQIGRCHRIIGQDGKAFYLVENESEKYDEHGIIEYKVAFSRNTGFTCTCPSGMHGFHRVGHPSGVCKHIRWAVACKIEEDTALHEISKKQESSKDLPIEQRWNLPTWMLTTPVAPSMRNSPKELR